MMHEVDCDALLYVKASAYPGINEEGLLEKFCGLNASAGAVVISKIKSAVFVDGRYDLAARLSVDLNKFSIESLSFRNIINWIKSNIAEKSRIAFDPRFFSHASVSKLKNELKLYEFVELNFEKLFCKKDFGRDCEIISQSFRKEKADAIYEIISETKADGYLVCDPCSVAWLLDVRDLKTKFTPVILGYLLITNDGKRILYSDDSYGRSVFDQRDRFDSKAEIILKTVSELHRDINSLQKIAVDMSETPSFIKHANMMHVKNPIPALKCIKSDDEVYNIKKTAEEDSIALINFMYWFYHSESISESDCADRVLAFRKESPNFVGNSFETIAAADEHSAIVHYSPTENSNKYIENFLLLDSGGQYRYGTTDITRTLAKRPPTDLERLYYTLVLKGHIAVADARLNKGSSGAILDKLARHPLKEHGLEYNHATGHGIGYMLNVHEGPIAISSNNDVPLQANMILSNEPGVYMENHIGVRLENMMLTCGESDIYFEIISLVPFDKNFIEFSLLTSSEKVWLNNYNDKILSTLKLPKDISNWVKKITSTGHGYSAFK